LLPCLGCLHHHALREMLLTVPAGPNCLSIVALSTGQAQVYNGTVSKRSEYQKHSFDDYAT